MARISKIASLVHCRDNEEEDDEDLEEEEKKHGDEEEDEDEKSQCGLPLCRFQALTGM
jgi:hypothetical protein